MTFTINDVSRCSVGGIHYRIHVTTAEAQSFVVETTQEELQALAPGDITEGRIRGLARIRSHLLETFASQPNFTQARNELVGKTFKI